MMRASKAVAPQRPFFVYFATGATHAPHQVPAEWIAKFKGQFDEGWDEYREKTFARQIETGRRAAGHEAHAAARLAPRLGFAARRTSGRSTPA